MNLKFFRQLSTRICPPFSVLYRSNFISGSEKNAFESLLRLTELSVNKIFIVTDASFSSFFDTWIAFIRYRENKDTLKFSVLLRQSPSDMSTYLIRARICNHFFSFYFNLHDENCFTEIMTTVF